MPKPLLKKFYFMSPVQVVKVTTHNIEQAAEWCGGPIKTTESRRSPGRTDKYIDVPVPKGAALVMAFPGMYITKRIIISLENEIKVTWAVFRKDYFEKNYFAEPVDSVDACWVRLANEETKPEPIPGTNQTSVTMNIHVANPGDVGKALEQARKNLLANKDKAEVNIINLIDATDSGSIEATFVDDVLTPAQQRMLITGDHVEQGVVPETANVVKQTGDTRHPSLREKQSAIADKAAYDAEMKAREKIQNTSGWLEKLDKAGALSEKKPEQKLDVQVDEIGPARQREINAAAHARLQQIQEGDPDR